METATFYITKYALTAGVFKIELGINTSHNNEYACSINGNEHFYRIGLEAFVNIEDAIDNVKLRKERKLKSIEKQLSKLKSIDFDLIIRSL